MYHFVGEENYQYVIVDFFVPGMAKELFRPIVKQGKILQLSYRLPSIFTSENWLQMIKDSENDFAFDSKTHMMSAFNTVAAKVTNNVAVGDHLYSVPQEISLPITVEEKINHWSLDAFW